LIFISFPQSLKADTQAHLTEGVGWAVMFFASYGAYALAFSFGITLIRSGHATPADVIAVLMSILIGSFSLLMLAPEMQGMLLAGCT
jgi:ATP-binding cassette subfamily B (MDR/TAP) protein 1